MRKIGNFIVIGGLMIFIFIVIYNNVKYNEERDSILKNGNYFYACIYEEFIGVKTVRDFKYRYVIDDYEYSNKAAIVNMEFFDNHQIGDTIIIKFLPENPKKSIIIEDKEYKECMGLPPQNGWKELPICTLYTATPKTKAKRTLCYNEVDKKGGYPTPKTKAYKTL